jgi:hypothetical protein
MLSKVKLGTQETAILTFCLTPTNTVYLTARMRSLDLPTLGEESFIRIETVISIQHDKWAPLRFRLEPGNDYMGRPGTLVSIVIDRMVYQQTFFPTVMFEDIQDNSDQRFIFGAKWQWGGARSPFFGYMGEMAFFPLNLDYPPTPSPALSPCSITEVDVLNGGCGKNQT